MKFSILDGINLTVSAMLIVIIALSLIMFAIMYAGRMVEKYEKVQTLLKEAESNELSTSAPAPVAASNVSKKTLFETDKLAKVAALTALAHASQDEPEKRFEIVSVSKK